MSRPAHTVFVYGTLLRAQVRYAVMGREATLVPATLPDYRRRALSGRPYPGIQPAAGESTPGGIIAVTAPELRRLDAYEGNEYRRQRVKVVDADGQQHAAFVYVLRRRYAVLMTDVSWDAPDSPAPRR